MMTGREGKNITRALNLYKVGSINLMCICTKKERTMERRCTLVVLLVDAILSAYFLIQILCHKQGVGSLFICNPILIIR